jgi:hypothetical protein
MFAPEGYVPLAEVWTWFEDKFGTWCQSQAIHFYETAELPMNLDTFGSPRDLCEDLFLKSLEDVPITLASADGATITVTALLSHSNARLFEKNTPLGSLWIAQDPEEAGAEKEWLIQMGSRQFVRPGDSDTHVNEWLQRRYGNTDGMDAPPPTARTHAFHTLPFLFERGSFVFPNTLPPWTRDMLEDAYLRNLKDACRGRSMCLSDECAAQWKKSVKEVRVGEIFEGLVKKPARRFEDMAKMDQPLSAGRPRKQDRVFDVLQSLPQNKLDLSRKELRRLVEEELNESVSMSVLDRARTALKGDSRDG